MRIVLALVVLATLAVLVLVALEFDKVSDVADAPDATVESTGSDAAGETDQAAGDVGDGEATGDQQTAAIDTDETDGGTAGATGDDAAQDGGAAQVAPSFDIVRVETTGDAVMAGRAEPFAIVEIYDHEGLVVSTQADGKGDWVVVLEEPLAPGSHELWLETPGEDGADKVESQETVVMLVPEPGDADAGASVTVTTNANTNAGAEPVAGATSDGAIAVLVPKDGDGKIEILQEPNAGVGIAGGDGLTLDTLDYGDSGDVSLSGQAQPGAEVRTYVDGALAGRTKADSAGNWDMTLDQPVEFGLHALRVDQVDEGGQVLSRLETPFDRASLQFPESAEPLVIIQPGNNLWTIARHTYGSGILYTQIFKANQGQIANPHLIYPGQIFVLPEIN
jgi:nucleoid-associated protein YgaU